MSETFRTEIVIASGKHSLDPDLVQGLVEQESGGNPWAWNPEPRYRYFWNVRTKAPFRAISEWEITMEVAPPDFPTLGGDRDQEWWAQQASWGLMQVMGAVARERGFTGTYLTRLCDPAANLEIGCRHLAHLFAWARGKYTGLQSQAEGRVRLSVLASYNGGQAGNFPNAVPLRNKAYAEQVIVRYDRIKATR
jgi:soluble lytic murein transglycosylase-like protein